MRRDDISDELGWLAAEELRLKKLEIAKLEAKIEKATKQARREKFQERQQKVGITGESDVTQQASSSLPELSSVPPDAAVQKSTSSRPPLSVSQSRTSSRPAAAVIQADTERKGDKRRFGEMTGGRIESKDTSGTSGMPASRTRTVTKHARKDTLPAPAGFHLLKDLRSSDRTGVISVYCANPAALVLYHPNFVKQPYVENFIHSRMKERAKKSEDFAIKWPKFRCAILKNGSMTMTIVVIFLKGAQVSKQKVLVNFNPTSQRAAMDLIIELGAVPSPLVDERKGGKRVPREIIDILTAFQKGQLISYSVAMSGFEGRKRRRQGDAPPPNSRRPARLSAPSPEDDSSSSDLSSLSLPSEQADSSSDLRDSPWFDQQESTASLPLDLARASAVQSPSSPFSMSPDFAPAGSLSPSPSPFPSSASVDAVSAELSAARLSSPPVASSRRAASPYSYYAHSSLWSPPPPLPLMLPERPELSVSSTELAGSSFDDEKEEGFFSVAELTARF